MGSLIFLGYTYARALVSENSFHLLVWVLNLGILLVTDASNVLFSVSG